MESVNICGISPDLKNLTEDTFISYIERHPECDIFLFPEYLLELVEITQVELEKFPNKLIVLGSKKVNNQNQLLIWNRGEFITVEKMALTPWEKDLVPGENLMILDFEGFKLAFLICFDIEFPEIASQLKGRGVDLLLVPSATENEFGYERVSRCSNARAVELGCAVMTCHLMGETEHDLIDKNGGSINFYLPSQSLFGDRPRVVEGPFQSSGDLVKTFSVPIAAIHQQREILEETNPGVFF